MLKYWHDNDEGRIRLIEGLTDAWAGLRAVVGGVADAFDNILPKLSGPHLVTFTKKFAELAKRFRDFALSEDVKTFTNRLGTAVLGIKGVLEFGARSAKAVLGMLKPLGGAFGKLVDGLSLAGYYLGFVFNGLGAAKDPLKYMQTRLPYIGFAVKAAAQGVEDFVKSVLDLVGIHVEGNPIMDLFDKLEEFASNHFDFSFVKRLGEGAKGALAPIKALGPFLSKVVNAAVGLIGLVAGGTLQGLGIFVEWLGQAAGRFGEFASSIDWVSVGTGALDKFAGVIAVLGDVVGRFAGSIGEKLPRVFEYLGSQDFRGIIQNFNALMGGLTLNSVRGFFDALTNRAKPGQKGSLVDTLKELYDNLTGNITEKVSGILDGLSQSLETFQERISPDKLSRIAVALGIMAGSIAVLALIEPDKVASGVTAIGAAMGILVGGLKAIESGSGMVTSTGLSTVATALIKMGIAIGVEAIAVRILSGLDLDELGTGLLGIMGIMAAMVITVSAMSQFGGVISDSVKGIVRFSIAVAILAGAVRIFAMSVHAFADLDPNGMMQGLAGVFMVLMEVLGFSQLLKGNTLDLKVAVGILALAGAVKILESSVEFFASMDIGSLFQGLGAVFMLLVSLGTYSQILDGKSMTLKSAVAILMTVGAIKLLQSTVSFFAAMDWNSIGKGLAGIAGLLLSIGTFSMLMKGNSLSVGSMASVLVISYVITVLADVVQSIGGMDWTSLSMSLTGLALGLGIMMGTLALMGSGAGDALVGSVALLVMAGALKVFVSVIESLNKMRWGTLLSNIGKFAVSVAVLGAAGALLGVLSPLLLFAGVALTVFGVGLGVTSAAIALFAAALTAAATAIVAGGGVITVGIVSILTGIAVGLAKGLIEFGVTLINGIDDILDALGKLIHTVGDFILENVPYICSLGGELLLSLMESLAGFIPRFADLVGQFVAAVFVAIVGWIPTIADALVQGAVLLMNAVANGIRDNAEAIFAAVRNLLSSVLELIVLALEDILGLIPGVGPMLSGELEKARGAIQETLAPESIGQTGADAVEGIAASIAAAGPQAVGESKSLGEEIKDAITEPFSEADVSADSFIGPLLASAEESVPQFEGIGDESLQAYLSSLSSGSASDATEALAETGVEGLRSVLPDYTGVGKESNTAFGSSLASTSVASSGATAARSGASGAASTRPQFVSTGAYVGKGIGVGVESVGAYLYNSGCAAARLVLQGAKDTAAVRSPSRKAMEIGSFISKGLIIGIEDLSKDVYRGGSNVGQAGIDGMKEAMSAVSRYIDADIVPDPTIRPVLDLSEIQNGVSQIGGIIGQAGASVPVGFDSIYARSVVAPLANAAGVNPLGRGGAVYNISIDGIAYNDDPAIQSAVIDLLGALKVRGDMNVG